MIRKKLTLCILTLALTLTACFTLLQAPKVFAANSPTTGFSDSVEDPAYADTYSTTWRTHFNCYAFALGRIDKSYNKTSGQDRFCEIGGYCGNLITENATTQDRLTRIRQDLTSLKCTNITVSTSLPDLSDDTYKYICYREGSTSGGDFDYHFMRYNGETEKWQHKPGTTGKALIYNYTPSTDRVWTYTNELEAAATATTSTYNGTIYYISYKETFGFNENLGANIIKDASTFEEMRKRPSENWCLGQDVSLSSISAWTSIENFTASFFGNGHSISQLKYRGAAKDKIGLFGTLRGTVDKLNLRSAEITITGDVNLTRTINIGAIAAVNEGNIQDCTVGENKTTAAAVLYSNTMANIGGIAGSNYGTISGSTVNFFTGVASGNIGAIAGYVGNKENCVGNIFTCNVNFSELHIYAGTVGGVTGYFDNGTQINKCEVNNTNISCYNGFPTTSASYYSSSHYGYAGGIAGWFVSSYTNVLISNCKIKNVKLSTGNESVDSSHGGRSFAPEVGLICGRAKTDKLTGCTTDSASTVTGNNLHTETWGFWPWEKGSWNQAQYVGSRLVGHAL